MRTTSAADGRAGTRDHRAGLLARRIEAASFSPPPVWRRLATVWGTLELMAASPASGRPPRSGFSAAERLD